MTDARMRAWLSGERNRIRSLPPDGTIPITRDGLDKLYEVLQVLLTRIRLIEAGEGTDRQ